MKDNSKIKEAFKLLEEKRNCTDNPFMKAFLATIAEDKNGDKVLCFYKQDYSGDDRSGEVDDFGFLERIIRLTEVDQVLIEKNWFTTNELFGWRDYVVVLRRRLQKMEEGKIQSLYVEHNPMCSHHARDTFHDRIKK